MTASAGRPEVALRRDLLRRLATPPWAGNVERWDATRSTPSRPDPDVVVAVPARNERERIVECLSACARSIALSGLRVRLIVLVNGSSDDTAERARRWAARRHAPITIVEVDFVPALAHAGAARRLALEIACRDARPDAMVLTTDADARPLPGWVAANARHLGRGAALVCGQVLPMADEAARLPHRLERLGALEARYRRGALALERLIDPDPWNRRPHHDTASGASLATRVRHLELVGGVPLVPCGEDRALARRARAAGLPVVHADDVAVEVSCRLRGRAAGGMADTIRYRCREPDPLCDEAIEPAGAVHGRLVRRAALRAAWATGAGRVATLERLGAGPGLARELAAAGSFEAAWDRYDRAVLEPARSRLRFAALPDELARLEALVARARARPVAALRTPDPIDVPSNAEQSS